MTTTREARGNSPFPALPSDWEPTRATLHSYTHGVSAIPRALARPHPRWWHTALRVRPNGLVTEAVKLPAGGSLHLRMDLVEHRVSIETSHGDASAVSMTSGLTGTAFAETLIDIAAAHGLRAEHDRSRFESAEPREYVPGHATAFWTTLDSVATALADFRSRLPDPAGPVLLWPHGFDISFEWYGSRMAEYEADGEITRQPAQLNFGFYPAGDAYFYSNPWPFDPALTQHDLPNGAVWHTDGWEGTKLAHSVVADDPDGDEKLREYLETVFRIARPTLDAG